MVLQLEIDIDGTKRQSQQRNKEQKESGGSERTLISLLNKSEVDLDANIPNVLWTLKENQYDLKQTLNCCRVVIKFANKAVKVNQSEDWLKATEQVLLNIDKYILSSDLPKEEKIPFTNLYIAKFSCLQVRNNSNEEAKKCLEKAISLSSNLDEEIEAYLTLAKYYENVSEYNEMKNYLDKCEKICQAKPILENYLAHVWLLLGHYYFFQFKFRHSRQNLIKARTKLKSILNKAQNETKESELTHRRLSDCLHYMGRIYHEQYELLKAAEYYIEAQRILEENQKKNFLEKEPGATAFYHLRLGQILEMCKIRDSANEHYSKSLEIFNNDGVSKSGLALVKLALANMIKDYPTSESKSDKPTLKKQKDQINEAMTNSLDTGYYRGYLLALLQLFWLYVRNLKFHLALPLVWKALTSDEFKKSGGVLLLYRYAKKFIFGIFYKIRFLVLLKLHSDKVLYRCHCPIHQNKQNEK
jgi:tetratricopeptide (TPR) repeat protein